MSRLTVITDRALERVLDLAGTAGDSLKYAANSAGAGLRNAGNSLHRHATPGAAEWLKTGAALGAVKTGGRVATKLVRRNPTVAVAAAVAGIGLLGYAVYRKHKRDQAALDGDAQRVDHRGNAQARRAARAQRRVAATPTDSSAE